MNADGTESLLNSDENKADLRDLRAAWSRTAPR